MAPEIIQMFGTTRHRTTNTSTNTKHTYTDAVDWWSLGVTIYRLLGGVDPFAASTYQQVQRQLMSQLRANNTNNTNNTSFEDIFKNMFGIPDYSPFHILLSEDEASGAVELMSGLMRFNPNTRMGRDLVEVSGSIGGSGGDSIGDSNGGGEANTINSTITNTNPNPNPNSNPNSEVCTIDDYEQLKGHPFFKGIDWEKLANKQVKPPYIPSAEEYSRNHTQLNGPGNGPGNGSGNGRRNGYMGRYVGQDRMDGHGFGFGTNSGSGSPGTNGGGYGKAEYIGFDGTNTNTNTNTNPSYQQVPTYAFENMLRRSKKDSWIAAMNSSKSNSSSASVKLKPYSNTNSNINTNTNSNKGKSPLGSGLGLGLGLFSSKLPRFVNMNQNQHSYSFSLSHSHTNTPNTNSTNSKYHIDEELQYLFDEWHYVSPTVIDLELARQQQR